MIVGVDYSTTSPAFCMVYGTPGKDEFSFPFTSLHFRNPKNYGIQFEVANINGARAFKFGSKEEKYEYFAEWLCDTIRRETHSSDSVHIVIEGYAFGAKGRGIYQIGENGGVLRNRIIQEPGWTFSEVPPTVIKKFATGRGNATKEDMYLAFQEENPTVDLKRQLWLPRSKTAKYQEPEKCQSPVSDLVDAYFIAKYGYMQGNPHKEAT